MAPDSGKEARVQGSGLARTSAPRHKAEQQLLPDQLWHEHPVEYSGSGNLYTYILERRKGKRSPPIARYGVFGVSTWPIGCDTPSPFSEKFPLERMRSGGAIPAAQLGTNIQDFQNHYTHEIIMFELFRGLQLQLSGVVRIS